MYVMYVCYVCRYQQQQATQGNRNRTGSVNTGECLGWINLDGMRRDGMGWVHRGGAKSAGGPLGGKEERERGRSRVAGELWNGRVSEPVRIDWPRKGRQGSGPIEMVCEYRLPFA